MSSKHREQHAEGEPKACEPCINEATPAEQAGAGPAPAAKAEPKASGAQASESNDATKVALLQAELALVREELSAVNDKYLRKLADDVNFRKRMAREKEDGQRYALSGLLGDLVPVLDDFDRAIASAESSKEYVVLHDGVQLIRRQFGQMLENKYGLQRIPAVGQPFDPNRHEAVAMVPAGPGEDCAEATVAEEFLPGYGLHDRILRTAKVRVRMPAPAQAAPAEGAAASGAANAPAEGAPAMGGAKNEN